MSVTASSISAADCLSGRLQAMSEDIPHVDDFTGLSFTVIITLTE